MSDVGAPTGAPTGEPGEPGESVDSPPKKSLIARWEPIVVAIVCVVAATVIVVKLVSRDDGPSADEHEQIVEAQEAALWDSCQDTIRTEVGEADEIVFPDLSQTEGGVEPVPFLVSTIRVKRDGAVEVFAFTCQGTTTDDGATYDTEVVLTPN